MATDNNLFTLTATYLGSIWPSSGSHHECKSEIEIPHKTRVISSSHSIRTP